MKLRGAVVLFGIAAGVATAQTPEAQMRTALAAKTGQVKLPTGVIEITREIVIPPDAHDLVIHGGGTTLRAGDAFRGRALLVVTGAKNVHIEGLALDGNREKVGRFLGLPPSEVMFSRFVPNNGILVEGSSGLEIDGVKAANIDGFAVLVNAGHGVKIHSIAITDSGGVSAAKHNNTTGGILLEEGTTDFEVTDNRIGNVRGNGIWTHSLYRSERNARGRIAGNEFAKIARDAIQVGHATEVRVEGNRGRDIGFPQEDVDPQGQPVGIDTAGNVDKSAYRDNQFEEMDGKCLDLDGFHDGEITGNTCVNLEGVEHYPFGNFGIVMNNSNPDMRSRNIRLEGNTLDGFRFGGIFVIGSGHTIRGNHLLHLNLAHCNDPGPINCAAIPEQPDILRSGIYLGAGADRPDAAKNNTIEGNEIVGYGMSRHCLGTAPGVLLSDNRVSKNECSDDAAVALARFGTQR